MSQYVDQKRKEWAIRGEGAAFLLMESRMRLALAFSREHNDLTKAALVLYGDDGAQISGVIRDHFPKDIKDMLRALCDSMNAAAGNAQDAKPHRMQSGTYRRIYDGIRAEVGSGFYL